jgi:hypothetical protein
MLEQLLRLKAIFEPGYVSPSGWDEDEYVEGDVMEMTLGETSHNWFI